VVRNQHELRALAELRSLGGTATSRMQKFIDIIRKTPISGKAPDGNGALQSTTINTASLIYLIDYAGYGPPVYRDLDAASRAWLESEDALPMLRLVAEANTASVDTPYAFSYGLYEAVTCSDYRCCYDLTKSRAYAMSSTQLAFRMRAKSTGPLRTVHG